jgi:hypothetical protein
VKFARAREVETPFYVDGQEVRQYAATDPRTLLSGLLDIIQKTATTDAGRVVCAVIMEVERWEVFTDDTPIPGEAPPISVEIHRGNG